jgi:hypothetical protein
MDALNIHLCDPTVTYKQQDQRQSPKEAHLSIADACDVCYVLPNVAPFGMLLTVC